MLRPGDDPSHAIPHVEKDHRHERDEEHPGLFEVHVHVALLLGASPMERVGSRPGGGGAGAFMAIARMLAPGAGSGQFRLPAADSGAARFRLDPMRGRA